MISISAIVLLILASLSSVIGTSIGQTSGAIQSPLFAVRTQHSIDTEEKNHISIQLSWDGSSVFSYPYHKTLTKRHT